MRQEKLQTIKLVVSDIDGTLMDENRLLSEQLITIIQKLQQHGIGFTFASGRLPYKIDPLMAQIHSTLPVVSCNGAWVYQGETVICKKVFQVQPLKSLIEIAMNQGDTVLYSLDGVEYCLHETEDSERKRKERGKYYPIRPITEEEWPVLAVVKVNILAHDTIAPLHNVLEQFNHLLITRYGDKGVEIVTKGVNKLTGITKVAEQLSISLSQVMAIGDNENDAELLQAVGVSVAVQNATPEIQTLSDSVTTRKGEQGVIEVLQQLLKAKEEEDGIININEYHL